MAASSTVEIVFVLGLAATIGAVAAAESLHAVDEARARGAARYLATRLQQARIEAVAAGATTALRVVRTGVNYQFTTYPDGNGNGVTARDVAAGVDAAIRPLETLGERFPGVEFGALSGLPPVDPGGVPPGTDPIRLGTGDSVSFTAVGTASPGSVYVLGRGGVQFAIRIFAETGKTRVMRFQQGSGRWMPIAGS